VGYFFEDVVIACGTKGSMKVNGTLYGIPLATSTLALYYKQNVIKTPPETTEELLALVQSGYRLVQVLNSFFLFGWGAAFGGKVVYDKDECILDKDGWINTISYLEQLEEQGAIYQIDYKDAVESFVTGDSSMFIDGSWALDAYKGRFGKNLGVIKMPYGPIDHASPFVVSSGFYVNPNSRDVQASLLLIKYLTSSESVTEFSNNANLIPSRIDVEPTLTEVREFKSATDYGTLMPQGAMYKTLWVYFDNMIEEILTDVVPLDEGLNNVCNQINEMNEK
jgi:arabinogalactan oligomer/maltooligosaccharide transport system substrate-binding protein